MEWIESRMGFVGVFVAVCYIAVFLLIMADLWSGVRKAKERGEMRTSLGFKRTVEKIQQYYNALIALSVTDLLQMFAIEYLTKFHGFTLAVFPWLTAIGALGICLIEVKSIMENAQAKTRKSVSDLAHLAEAIKDSQRTPEAVAAEIIKYLNGQQGEKGKNDAAET